MTGSIRCPCPGRSYPLQKPNAQQNPSALPSFCPRCGCISCVGFGLKNDTIQRADTFETMDTTHPEAVTAANNTIDASITTNDTTGGTVADKGTAQAGRPRSKSAAAAAASAAAAAASIPIRPFVQPFQFGHSNSAIPIRPFQHIGSPYHLHSIHSFIRYIHSLDRYWTNTHSRKGSDFGVKDVRFKINDWWLQLQLGATHSCRECSR